MNGNKQTTRRRAKHGLEPSSSGPTLTTSTISSSLQSGSPAEASTSGPYNILIALRSIRRLITVDEVSELLTNSACTVYRMVRQNEIPHMMIGGSLRFDPSALEAWLVKKEPELARVAYQLSRAA